MGITKRVTSVSLGCEAERQISEIQDAFAPTFASRSHMLRFLIGIMHRIIFSGASLEEFVRLLQGLHASNSCYEFPLPSQAGDGALKFGPKRIDSLAGNQAERPKNSVTRRWAVAKESEAKFFSFESPSIFRSVFAWRIA